MQVAPLILILAAHCGIAAHADEPGLLAPSLGRPAIVAAGESFAIAAAVDGKVEKLSAQLVYRRDRAIRIALALPDDAAARIRRGESIAAKVPASAPVGTFDLELRLDATTLVQPHSVSVWTPARRIRLVHLSDIDYGDLSTPALDPRLVDEINLIAPTLVILTGDLVEPATRDVIAAWHDVTEYLESIDAPLLIALGDHDVPELYSRFIAPSPVGAIRVGDCRGIVLSDHALGSIADDPGQRAWVEKLSAADTPGLTFVVAHADTPTLLDLWSRDGRCGEFVRSLRLGVWFSGGDRDTAGDDAALLPPDARRMVWLRTAPPTGTTRGGATGTPRYRVLDLEDDRVLLLGLRDGATGIPASFSVGGFSGRVAGDAAGRDSRVRIDAASALPFGVDGLCTRVRVRKTGDAPPWCSGAVIEQALDCDSYWDCRVRYSVPARGGIGFTVGAGSAPLATGIVARIDMASPIELHAADDAAQSGLLTAARSPGLVALENRGAAAEEVRVQIRLAGESLAFRIGDEIDLATTAKVALGPGESLILRPELAAVRVAAGLREMQVYLEDEYSLTPTVRPIEVRVVGSSPPATQ